MPSWLQTLIVTMMAGGGIAVGTGLYKLGITLGEIGAVIEGHDRRLNAVEAHVWGSQAPAGRDTKPPFIAG